MRAGTRFEGTVIKLLEWVKRHLGSRVKRTYQVMEVGAGENRRQRYHLLDTE